MALQIDVVNQKKVKQESVNLRDELFAGKAKPYLLHEVTRWQLNKSRAGTAKTKVRHEVRGGGKKPYRQKGTGNARQGSIRSPLCVGGGKVFGPVPRSYEPKVNAKVRRAALKMALSDKIKKGNVHVLDSLKLTETKTKMVAQLMHDFDLKSVLFVDEENKALALASRNIPDVKFIKPEGVNVYDVMRFPSILITKPALQKLQDRLLRA